MLIVYATQYEFNLFSGSTKYLYVITQSAGGTIRVFDINPRTGELTKNSDLGLTQAGLNVILGNAAISLNGKFLYLGDQSFSIIRFAINNDGSLTVNPLTDKFTEGVGAMPRNIIISPSGKNLYHLGVNNIYSYTIEPSNGALTPIFNASNGFGYGATTNTNRANVLNQIRGLAISLDGKQLYVTDLINSKPADAGLYIFNIQQIDDIVFDKFAGGLYSPGELAQGNNMPSGQTVISTKIGRCPVP